MTTQFYSARIVPRGGSHWLACIPCLLFWACNRPPAEKPQPSLAEPTIQLPEIENAKFAFITDEDVQIAVVTPSGIQLLERVDVPLTPIALHWIDVDKLVILTHNDDEEPARFELLVYQDKALKLISLPDSEAWNVPHRDDYSAHDVGGAFLNSGDNELWMRRCAGGYLGDADGCTTFSYVRILPSVLEKQTTPPKHADFGIRFVEAPKDIHVEVVPSEDGMTSAIECKSGTQSSTYTGSRYTGDDTQVHSFMPEFAFWVSTTPPIYAVNETDESGEGLFDYYWLFSPCETEPHSLELVAEYDFVYGPEGVWAAGSGVYFANRRVGEVDFGNAYIPRYSGPALAFSPSPL